MSPGDGLRIFIIAIGVVILVASIVSLSRKHMTETFCIAWGIVALGSILAGILLTPTEWSHYVSWHGLMAILFAGLFLLSGAFFFSVRISQLNRQVKELAIRVAILDQENATLLNKVADGIQETEAYEEEALIRH